MPKARFWLFVNDGHLNDIVRAVLLAIAATDTTVINIHFTMRRAVNGVRRAIFHAVRMLAMPA